MPSENVQATDVPPEHLPMLPCRVFICDIDQRPYPRYVPGSHYVHSWQRTDGQPSAWIQTVVENFTRVYDENIDEYMTVLPTNMDSECSWCGNGVHEPYIHRTARRRMRRTDEIICRDCRDNNGIVCENTNCDIYVYDDNAYELNNSYYCESCYYDVTTSCEYCDERYHVDDDPSCGCVSRLIQSYSTKFSPLRMHMVDSAGALLVTPSRYLQKRDVNNIFLGLEFEMENMSGYTATTEEISQLFLDPIESEQLMLKHDGSINDGFELVSQPHTLDAFMHHFPWDLIEDARKKGMRGWDVGHREIGIHIHINRKAFHSKPEHNRYNASPHLLGFMHFIYRNVPSIKRIAGRNVHYGHMDEAYLDESFRICRYGRSQSRRTLGINLQNDETVELRMFRSTMRVERVQAYLQFAEAAVRYTQTDRVSKMRDRFNFRQFATWCSFQERYKQLNDLIAETNAIDYARPIDRFTDVHTADTTDEFVPSQPDLGN